MDLDNSHQNRQPDTMGLQNTTYEVFLLPNLCPNWTWIWSSPDSIYDYQECIRTIQNNNIL